MNTVVYYPYVDPTPEWLRLAALCWDKVFVLTGPHVPHDPAIAELDAALGDVIDRRFSVAEIADASLVDRFKTWVLAHEAQLQAGAFTSQTRQTLFAIHPSKFESGPAQEAFGFLASRGLAEIGDLDEDSGELARAFRESVGPESVFMAADVALHYLSLCAAKVASSANSDLVADGDRFANTVMYDYRALRGDVATSVLEAHVPKGFESMEPQRIAEFRQAFSAQRLKFNREVQAICREFGDVASEGELQQVKDRIVAIANERIAEVRQTYERGRLEIVTKSLSISLAPPALVSTLASVLDVGIFAPGAIAGALSLIAAKTLADTAQARMERKKSPWSYALDSASLSARPRFVERVHTWVTRTRAQAGELWPFDHGAHDRAAPSARDGAAVSEERRRRKEAKRERKMRGRAKDGH